MKNKICSIVLLLIMVTLPLTLGGFGCSGGDGSSKPHVELQPGVSGKVCLSSATSYTITDEKTGESRTEQVEVDPLLTNLLGSFGGHLRAVAAVNMTRTGELARSLLVWGSGASIRYGGQGFAGGSLAFHRRGALTDMVAVDGSERRLFFGTEESFGLTRIHDSGKLELIETSLRSFPSGVLSVTARPGSDDLLFVTGDGHLLSTTASKLTNAESCFGLLTTTTAMTTGTTNYRPLQVEMVDHWGVVLAGRTSTVSTGAPTLSEYLAPFFQSVIEEQEVAIVRAIDTTSHGVVALGYDTADESFKSYDRFAPTDIAVDGKTIYVAGLLYEQKEVKEFIDEICGAGSLSDKIKCASEAANIGYLVTLKNTKGLNVFGAGFFIYRDLNRLLIPDHFEMIPLTASKTEEGAPPFFFRIAPTGDQLFFRTANFIMRLSKGADESGKERWKIENSIDSRGGVTPGIPSQMAVLKTPTGTGVAMTLTAARAKDGTGENLLELVGPDGSVAALDQSAILTRIEAANEGMIAAVGMVNQMGGTLFLHTANASSTIDTGSTKVARVAAVALKEKKLAFAWSEEPSASRPSPSWHVIVQDVEDHASRGEEVVSRAGGNGPYDGFPVTSRLEAGVALQSRGIGDIAFQGSHLFVLYEGNVSTRWYHQVGVYTYNDKNKPKLVGLTKTIQEDGASGFQGGRFLRINQAGGGYQIFFAAADGLRRFEIMPGTVEQRTDIETVELAHGIEGFLGGSCDVGTGMLCALAEGFRVHLVDLREPGRKKALVTIPSEPGTGLDRLVGISMALLGSRLVVATPYGATVGLTVVDLSNPAEPRPTATCTSCHFHDVALFAHDPNLLYTSSATGGVEIYNLTTP